MIKKGDYVRFNPPTGADIQWLNNTVGNNWRKLSLEVIDTKNDYAAMGGYLISVNTANNWWGVGWFILDKRYKLKTIWQKHINLK